MMKAGIVFTGTGPIVVLTACDSLEDPRIVTQLSAKGIKKYIAYEIPVDLVKEKYGQLFSITLRDFKQTDDLRVVDADGLRIFNNFPMNQYGQPIYHEAGTLRRAA
jgi:hypothetical protein